MGGPSPLPQLRFDELLDELQARIVAIRATRDRIHSLLEAVLAVGRGLDLEAALHRIVEAAATLVDAKYAAMGVIGEDGEIAQFLTVGVTEDEIKQIGPYPKGRGILGELIKHPQPLRLADISTHPASFGFPPNHPPMKTFVGAPVRVRDEVFGNLYITEKRGGIEFDDEDEQLLQTLAAAAGVAIENARLYEGVRRRERWLRASSEITRLLLSGASPADVLSPFAEEAKDMADADLVAIAVPVRGADALAVEVATGPNAEVLQGKLLAFSGTFAGTVFHANAPVVTTDARTDSRGYAALDPDGTIGPLIVAPLSGADGVRGLLIVGRRAGQPPFSPTLTDMLTAFSGQAAIALELAERRKDAERLTVLQDRDRIARDLHDLAIQRLFATGLSLEGIGRLIENPAAAERIARAVDDLDETIKLIRTTIFSLQSRDSEAEKRTLRARALTEIEAATPTLGFPPALRLEGPLDSMVPAGIAEHLIAVLREGLSNIARHANASHADVTLSVADDVAVRIADDGVGIPSGSTRSGLRNLSERAAALGGAMTVGPGAGQGTVLEWRVPLGGGN